MTETHPTPAGTAPVFPPGRYGRRRRAGTPQGPWRRTLPYALALLAAVGGLGVALRLHAQYGEGAYDATVIRFYDVTDHQVVVQFRVNLPSGRGARCVIRARGRDGAQVGRAETDVPASTDDRPLVTFRLPTTARPVTGEVEGCGPRP